MEQKYMLRRVLLRGLLGFLLMSSQWSVGQVYTTGQSNWSEVWNESAGKFDFTNGIGLFSFGTTTQGNVQGRFFTVDGSLNGTQRTVKPGQRIRIRIAGQDGGGRDGIVTNGIIGVSIKSGGGMFDGSGLASRYDNNSILKIEFVGGQSTARFTDGSDFSTVNMPNFTNFKSGVTYDIEVISDREFNIVIGSNRNNIRTFAGSSGVSPSLIHIRNSGANMDGLFTLLEVFDQPINLTANTSESLTVTGVISNNESTSNSVNKNGSGTVILTNQNTYSGLTSINNGTLQLNRTGGTTIPSNNIVTLNSGATLRVSSNQSLSELNINGGTVTIDSGVTLTVETLNVTEGSLSGVGSLRVNEVLNKTTSGEFITNGQLILTSNATSTARVAQVSGSITGNVTTERYLPAKRAWRLLASPVKGTTNHSVFANWQNNGNDNGRGLLLWHPSPVGTATPTSSNSGLFVGAQPNIYSYVDGAWVAVTNTNTTNISTASQNNAFMVFVTGPHASNNFTTTSAVTTSVASGQLITGNVNHSIVANQFTLLGNPYASPINPVSLVSNNSGSKLWMLDPSVGLGAYVTYDGNEWVPEAPSGNDAYIQSGQGFFVRSTQTSFNIAEADKIAGNSNTWFAKQSVQNTNENKIRVLLDKQINNEWQLADGILSVSGNNYSNEVDAQDALKVTNFNENIQFRNGTNNLAIEYQSLPTATIEQPIRLTGTTATSYRLRVRTEGFVSLDVQPILQDTQSGTNHLIPTDGTTIEIPFTGVVSTTSTPDNRFKIVYQQVLGVEQPINNTLQLYPNPITEGQFVIALPTSNEVGSYEITNYLGQVVQKGNLTAGNTNVSIASQAVGVYLVRVQQNGEVYTTKIVKK
ncbi:MAG: T9SS type A sorting domain-containing protein [Flavobacterium sp.]